MYFLKIIIFSFILFWNISTELAAEDLISSKDFSSDCLSPSSQIKGDLLVLLEKVILTGGEMITSSIDYGTDITSSFLLKSSQKLSVIYNEFLHKGDISGFTFVLKSVFLPLIEKYPDENFQKKVFLETLEYLFLKLKEEGKITSIQDNDVWYSLMFELYKIRFRNSQQKYSDKNSSNLAEILLNKNISLWMKLKTIFLLKEIDGFSNESNLKKECLGFFKVVCNEDKDNQPLMFEFMKAYVDFGLYNENAKTVNLYMEANPDSPYVMYLSLLLDVPTKEEIALKSKIINIESKPYTPYVSILSHMLDIPAPSDIALKSNEFLGNTVSIEHFGQLIFDKYFKALEIAVEETNNPALIFHITQLIEIRYTQMDWNSLPYTLRERKDLYSGVYLNIFKILATKDKKYGVIDWKKFIFSIQQQYLNNGELTNYIRLNQYFLKAICSSEEEVQLAENIFNHLKNALDIERDRKSPHALTTKEEAIFEEYAKALDIYYDNKENFESFKSLNFIPFVFSDFIYQLKFYEFMMYNHKPYAKEFIKNSPFFIGLNELSDSKKINSFQQAKIKVFDAFLNLKKTLELYKESKDAKLPEAFIGFYEQLFNINELLKDDEVNEIKKIVRTNQQLVKTKQDFFRNRLNSFKKIIGKLSESLVDEYIDVTTDGEQILKAASLMVNMLNEENTPASYMMAFEFLTHQVINDESLYKDKSFSYDVFCNITILMKALIDKFSISAENVYHPAYTETIEMTISEFKYLYVRFLVKLAELASDVDSKIEFYSKAVEVSKSIYDKKYKKRFYNFQSQKVFSEKNVSFHTQSLSDSAKKEIDAVLPLLNSLVLNKKRQSLASMASLPINTREAIIKETAKINHKKLNSKNIKDAISPVLALQKDFESVDLVLNSEILKETLSILLTPLVQIIEGNTYNDRNVRELNKMLDECMLFNPKIFTEVILSNKNTETIAKFIFSGLMDGLSDKRRIKNITKNNYLNAIIHVSADLFQKYIEEEEILNLFKLIMSNLSTEHEYKPRLVNILKMYNKNEFIKLANELLKERIYYVTLEDALKIDVPLINDIKSMDSYMSEFELKYFLRIYGVNGRDAKKIGNIGISRSDVEFIIKECKSKNKHIGHLTNILNNALLIQANLSSFDSYDEGDMFSRICKTIDGKLDFDLFEGVWNKIPSNLQNQDCKHKGDIALKKAISSEAEYFMKLPEYNGVYAAKEEWEKAILNSKKNRLTKEAFIISSIFKPLYFKNNASSYLTEEMFEEAFINTKVSTNDFDLLLQEEEISMFQNIFSHLSSEAIKEVLLTKGVNKLNTLDAFKELTFQNYYFLKDRTILPEKDDQYSINAITAKLTSREDFTPSKLQLLIRENEIQFLKNKFLLEDASNEFLQNLLNDFKEEKINRTIFKEKLQKHSVEKMSKFYINALRIKYKLIDDMFRLVDYFETIQDEVIKSSFKVFNIEDIEKQFQNPFVHEEKYLDFIVEELSQILFMKYVRMPLYFIKNEIKNTRSLSLSFIEYVRYLNEEAGMLIENGLDYYYDRKYNTIVFRLFSNINVKQMNEYFSSLENRAKLERVLNDAIKNNSCSSLYMDTIDDKKNQLEIDGSLQILHDNLNEIFDSISKKTLLLEGVNTICEVLAKGSKKESIQNLFKNYFIYRTMINRQFFEVANGSIKNIENEVKRLNSISTIMSKLQGFIDVESSFYLFSSVNSILVKMFPNENSANITLKSHVLLSRILQMLEGTVFEEPIMLEYKTKELSISA